MSNFYKSGFYSKPIEVCNINGEIIVIITDNTGREIIYSWYDIEEKTSESIYINKCLLGGFIKRIPKNVLIIGFGGGAFAKYLQDHINNIKITGIDIDKTMLEIAKKELNIEIKDFYILDVMEALKIIQRKKKKYDLILIDVYGSNGEIPEYFQENIFSTYLKNILFKDGIISVNFANYDLNNKKISEKYDKLHSNLIDNFGKYYSHLLSGKNDRGNVSGIYNLDKNYNVDDYNFNYLKKVEKGDILYDANIIKNTVID